jgi:PleD family two-component response regulator
MIFEQGTGNPMAADTAKAGMLPDNASHILVVDDDQRIRDLLARYLQENGYRVSVAADAAAAWAALRGLAFDAIILDVMMPGEDGVVGPAAAPGVQRADFDADGASEPVDRLAAWKSA